MNETKALTREQLEARCTELNIPFRSTAKDETLAAKVAEAEAALAASDTDTDDEAVQEPVFTEKTGIAVPEKSKVTSEDHIFQTRTGKRKGTFEVTPTMTLIRN